MKVDEQRKGARPVRWSEVPRCTAFVLLATTALAAQQPQHVERVDVARVLIDARVVDDGGRPVIGLEPADFEVKIDGKHVRVESAQ